MIGIRRPYVLINVAASADGKIDTVARRGAPISSDHDRARVDELRASVDGVMVGGRTLLDEDPRLTVKSAELRAARVARGLPEQPAKIGIVSRPGLLRRDSRFLSAGSARVILFAPLMDEADDAGGDVAALRAAGAEVVRLGTPRVDLAATMGALHELGIGRVLVEGGGSLNFELLRLGLVDELQVFVAPLIFGGATAPTLADGAGLTRELALRLSPPEVTSAPDGGVLLRYKVEQS